jgi:hypothetical protein
LKGLTTSNLDDEKVIQEVRAVKIDGQTLQKYLGGKTLEQHLEQLRVFATFRKRAGTALQDYLAQFSSS